MNEPTRGLDGAAGGCALIALMLLALVLAVVVIPQSLGSLKTAEAQRDLARAELERAQTERDAQAAVDFRRDLMVWSIGLKSAGDGALVVVATGAAALLGGYMVGMNRKQYD
jgi:hypothetical protein